MLSLSTISSLGCGTAKNPADRMTHARMTAVLAAAKDGPTIVRLASAATAFGDRD
jgi:hypothetical protein